MSNPEISMPMTKPDLIAYKPFALAAEATPPVPGATELGGVLAMQALSRMDAVESNSPKPIPLSTEMVAYSWEKAIGQNIDQDAAAERRMQYKGRSASGKPKGSRMGQLRAMGITTDKMTAPAETVAQVQAREAAERTKKATERQRFQKQMEAATRGAPIVESTRMVDKIHLAPADVLSVGAEIAPKPTESADVIKLTGIGESPVGPEVRIGETKSVELIKLRRDPDVPLGSEVAQTEQPAPERIALKTDTHVETGAQVGESPVKVMEPVSLAAESYVVAPKVETKAVEVEEPIKLHPTVSAEKGAEVRSQVTSAAELKLESQTPVAPIEVEGKMKSEKVIELKPSVVEVKGAEVAGKTQNNPEPIRLSPSEIPVALEVKIQANYKDDRIGLSHVDVVRGAPLPDSGTPYVQKLSLHGEDDDDDEDEASGSSKRVAGAVVENIARRACSPIPLRRAMH